MRSVMTVTWSVSSPNSLSRTIVPDQYLIFFSQAEDGIRDVAVTGVQTCALPISCPRSIVIGAMMNLAPFTRCERIVLTKAEMVVVRSYDDILRRELRVAPRQLRHHVRNRSEERRVGKECRSRWSPYH